MQLYDVPEFDSVSFVVRVRCGVVVSTVGDGKGGQTAEQVSDS